MATDSGRGVKGALRRAVESTDATPAIKVCVLGMHRSGTSVTTRLLHLMGMHLGKEANLIPPMPSNPLGHWENRLIVELNDAILFTMGGTWHQPPRLDPGWESDPRLSPLFERARGVLQEEFGQERFWGWKDPRTCLTLPFWKRVTSGLRCVLCIRHPMAVARSLEGRDRLPVEASLELWRVYCLSALEATGTEPLLTISYEALLQSPVGQAQRLARFVGVSLSPPVVRSVESAVVAELCHHPSDPGSDARLPEAVRSLYAHLLGKANQDL